MAATRILLGVFWAGVLGGSAALAQTGPAAPGTGVPTMPPPLASPGTGQPTMPPPASPGGGPTATLTAPPGPPAVGAPLPPGAVASPWCGGSPAGANCCGPVGANGPVTYELYVRTGPNIIVGGSREFSSALTTGWVVAGGGRTLLYNQAGDAAWALDLGLGYNYTPGDPNRVLDVFSPRELDQNTGRPAGPDEIHPFRVRSLHRTTFNYAVGRDWFLNGPGFLGSEQASNARVGFDVGGRWGTAHADLVPVADPVTGYLRRSGVTHSLFLGTNFNWEVPMGAWVLVLGGRVEWGVTMMNLVPPQDGKIQDVNLLMLCGVRF